MHPIIEAIYLSSDFSTSVTLCIDGIVEDIDNAVGPIADSLESYPEQRERLERICTDRRFAASIQNAIWPNNNKGAIATKLEEALEPVAAPLDAKEDPVAKQAAAKLRELFAGDTSYAAAIKVDPNARPLRESVLPASVSGLARCTEFQGGFNQPHREIHY